MARKLANAVHDDADEDDAEDDAENGTADDTADEEAGDNAEQNDAADDTQNDAADDTEDKAEDKAEVGAVGAVDTTSGERRHPRKTTKCKQRLPEEGSIRPRRCPIEKAFLLRSIRSPRP